MKKETHAGLPSLLSTDSLSPFCSFSTPATTLLFFHETSSPSRLSSSYDLNSFALPCAFSSSYDCDVACESSFTWNDACARCHIGSSIHLACASLRLLLSDLSTNCEFIDSHLLSVFRPETGRLGSLHRSPPWAHRDGTFFLADRIDSYTTIPYLSADLLHYGYRLLRAPRPCCLSLPR
jgi:hypothetical protein